MNLFLVGGVVLGAILFGPLSYLAGDWYGSHATKEVAMAKLDKFIAQGQRDAAHQDLVVASLAAARAEAEQSALAAEAAEAKKRSEDYEAELAKRPPGDRCELTDGDVNFLRPRAGAGSGTGGQGASSGPSRGPGSRPASRAH